MCTRIIKWFNKEINECRTLFGVITDVVKHSWFKIIFATAMFSSILGVSVYDYNKNIEKLIAIEHKYYPLYVLLINLLLGGTIVLFVFISRSMDRRIKGLKNAFKNEETYKEKCNNFFSWIHLGFGDWDYASKDGHKHYRVLQIVVKLIYLAVWGFGMRFFYGYVLINTSLFKGYSGILSGVLFFISSCLQCYSFFSCSIYLLFLHKICRNEDRSYLINYHFNRYLPSQTSGFKQLMSNINFNATCYIFTSLMFMSAYICLIRLVNRNVGLDVINSMEQLLFYIMYTSLCIIGSIIMYIVPKYMMKRILTSWVSKSREQFEKELDKIDKISTSLNCAAYEKYQSQKMSLIENILRLDKETYVYREDIINLVFVGLTLAVTAIPVIIRLIELTIKQ